MRNVANHPTLGHEGRWEFRICIPAAKKGVAGVAINKSVSSSLQRWYRSREDCNSRLTYPACPGTFFRGETLWKIVRKRREFRVCGDGDGDVCRGRGEVRFGVCPGPGRLAALGRAVAALPIFSDAHVNNHRIASHCIAISQLPRRLLIMTSSLASSVTSLQSSLQLLDNSIATLDAGVNDFPRLCKVLQTTRVW